MENNTPVSDVVKKKNNLVIIIVALIVLVVIIIVVMKNGNRNTELKPEQAPISQSDKDLNQAVTTDTTKSIITNIDSIDVSDTGTTDMNPVDQELLKL